MDKPWTRVDSSPPTSRRWPIEGESAASTTPVFRPSRPTWDRVADGLRRPCKRDTQEVEVLRLVNDGYRRLVQSVSRSTCTCCTGRTYRSRPPEAQGGGSACLSGEKRQPTCCNCGTDRLLRNSRFRASACVHSNRCTHAPTVVFQTNATSTVVDSQVEVPGQPPVPRDGGRQHLLGARLIRRRRLEKLLVA